MAFRISDERDKMFEHFKRFYVLQLPDDLQEQGLHALNQIDSNYGGAVHHHPIWHPLAQLLGGFGFYEGHNPLSGEHRQCLMNGILFCPYNNGQNILDHVNSLPEHPYCTIKARRLDAKLWHPKTTSILVTCDWKIDVMLEPWGTFKLSKIVPLLLDVIQPDLINNRAWSAIPWDRFSDEILGYPCGKVSSVFVGKPEGQMLKKLWEIICQTGMLKRED